MQQRGIGGTNDFAKFRQRASLGLDLANRFQGDEAVGLDGKGLVELRSEGKIDLNHITVAQPVKWMAFPHWE